MPTSERAFMRKTSTDVSIGETVRDQHHKLQRILARAQRLSNRPRVNPLELWACFNELAQAVDTHFRTEEKNGWFKRIVIDAPHVARRTAELCDEHRLLRKMVFDLVREISSLTAPAEMPSHISEAFTEFHTKFLRHERKEDELLEDVYNNDHGAID